MKGIPFTHKGAPAITYTFGTPETMATVFLPILGEDIYQNVAHMGIIATRITPLALYSLCLNSRVTPKIHRTRPRSGDNLVTRSGRLLPRRSTVWCYLSTRKTLMQTADDPVALISLTFHWSLSFSTFLHSNGRELCRHF